MDIYVAYLYNINAWLSRKVKIIGKIFIYFSDKINQWQFKKKLIESEINPKQKVHISQTDYTDNTDKKRNVFY